MKNLGIDELHNLRLRIFENARSLHKEAILLYENEFYARACLLSYFACEELGKIPIVVGVIGKLMVNEAVDWKKVMRRFRDHKEKVNSDNFHHYIFGIEADPLRNSDVEWLNNEMQISKDRVGQKNGSTYVDIVDGCVLLPSESITKDQSSEMIARALRSLDAHWRSENITNPVLRG